MVQAKISLTAVLLSLYLGAGVAFAKGSGDDGQTAATHHHHYVHSHKIEPAPKYVLVKDKHGRTHRVTQQKSSVERSISIKPTETKHVLVVVRDKHGRTHKVYRDVAAAPERATHKVSKRVAVMVRDRRGRLHKVYKTEVVQVPDDARAEYSSGKKAASGKVSSAGKGNSTASGRHDSHTEEVVTSSHSNAKDSESEAKGGDEPERMNPSFGKSYALYDEGANARISGNYPLAISCLGRALAMVPANSHGGPSVLQLNMEFELAQSAEAHGDMTLAARYYARALSDRPNFTEASVRLATVLARAGNYPEAIRAARAAVQRSPNDPRTHAILTVLLEKTGAVEEAKSEKMKTKSLMANLYTIDTAPLVPPNTVINDAPPAQVNDNPGASDTAPANNPAMTPGAASAVDAENDIEAAAKKSPPEKKPSRSAPQPGAESEEMN